MQHDDTFAEIWRDQHDRLVARATRMLGDAAAAEDVVQEAFRRLDATPLNEIDDVGGWMAVVVRRLCLTRMRAAYVRHEAIGVEVPIVADVDPLDRVTLDDEVQAALAVVLDALTPAERTAFVLHDVFGFPFDAVAAIVGRSDAAVRQLASRARRAIRRDQLPPAAARPDTREHDVVVERFIAACAGGDIGALVAVLDPDVVLRSDGGRLTGLSQHVRGAANVAGQAMVWSRVDLTMRRALVNGAAGMVTFLHGRPFSIAAVTIENGKIVEIDFLADPERIARLDLTVLGD